MSVRVLKDSGWRENKERGWESEGKERRKTENGRTYPYRHQHKERNNMRRRTGERVRRDWEAVVSYSVSKVQHDVSMPCFFVRGVMKGRTYKTPSHIHVAIDTPAASLPNMSVRRLSSATIKTPDKRGDIQRNGEDPFKNPAIRPKTVCRHAVKSARPESSMDGQFD